MKVTLNTIRYPRGRWASWPPVPRSWLYSGFTLSLPDVEERLAQRGMRVSYETIPLLDEEVRPLIARQLKKLWPCPSHYARSTSTLASHRAKPQIMLVGVAPAAPPQEDT